jgi:predicted RND superfamily exporter protein
MKRFARLVTRHPVAVLLATVLVTLAALHGLVDLGSGRLRLEVDPSVQRLLPEGDEERRFYDRARELFGSDQFLLLSVESPAGDVFTRDFLARLERLTETLGEIEGVHRVLSIANALAVESRDDEVYVGPFFEEVPAAPAALEALRARMLGHPVYGHTLVSEDQRATAVLVRFDRMSDREFVRRGLGDEVATLAARELPGAEVIVTGPAYVKARLSRKILAEMAFILPGVLGLSSLLAYLAFRSVRGVLLPQLTIGIALVWTLGTLGWSGEPFNLVSNIVPPLVMTLGFAATIHVLSEYYEILHQHPARDREQNRAAVERVLEEMGLTIAVNGFTTMLGFLSLLTSRVTAIREFGIWSTLGVGALTGLCLTALPAALVLLGPPRRLPRPAGDETRVDRLVDRLARFDVRNRRHILIASFALLLLCGVGIARIEISTGLVEQFFEDSPIRKGFETVSRRYGGLNTLFVVVAADEDGAFAQPENLREIERLQAWIAQQPDVGHATSLVDPLILLNRALSEDPGVGLPEREGQARQLLLFAGDELREGLVDARERTVNVLVRTHLTESKEVRSLLERIEGRLAELPRRLQGRVTGDAVLLHHTVDDIARGQLESLGTALFTIYLTLAALLTSFRVGLYALLPNVLPLGLFYGALGLLGVPLNLSTSLIGAITLGIAVDDTVHYFARFALEARRIGSESAATVRTMRMLVRPVTFTTIAVCLGFLVLTFSELRYQFQFGLLSAFTLASGWLFELTLSPALCSGLRIVTLWDLLRIDLGPEPQRSIPLFAGLSERQARIFALMSDLVSVPRGQRLFGEGETGSDLYVVIEGELAASTTTWDGRRVEYGKMGRGDVVGEVAMFSHVRSADVDVSSDARLLRFDEGDLERIARRYPRIAAHVNRNLNHVLARRVMNTAQTLR